MFMKLKIRIVYVFLFCLFSHFLSAQDLVITEKTIDGFIQDILRDKRIDYVYSKRGQIFSDFYILDNNEKVITIYRSFGKATSNGTPILFLDHKNITKDSLYILGWPANGTPEIFSPLSMIEDRLIFIPGLVYPSKEILDSPKKPTRGLLTGIQNQDEIRFVDFSSPNNLFGKYFNYDGKKETLNSKKNEISFRMQDLFYRHKGDKIMIFNHTTHEFFLFQKSTGIMEQRFIYSEKDLVNFDIVDPGRLVISAKNRVSSEFEIVIMDLESKEENVIYAIRNYLPRVKAFDQRIYFELSSKFSDSDFQESILFQISLPK